VNTTTDALSARAKAWIDGFAHLFGKRNELDGLDEEIEGHLELLERDMVTRGVPAGEARAEALRAFGDPGAVRRSAAFEIRKERIMAGWIVGGVGFIVAGAIGATVLDTKSDWRKVAPYTGLRIAQDGDIEVRHQGTWWTLDAIDGVTAKELASAAEETFGGDLVEKRLAEDIYEVLTAAGHGPGHEVMLSVSSIETGEKVIFDGVEMTEDNRRASWTLRNGESIAHSSPAWRRVAPFAGLLIEGDAVRIEHDGVWWYLRSIDGIETGALIGAAAAEFGRGLVHKRLGEDIYEVLVAAGWTPDTAVDLELSVTPDGATLVVHDVSMTSAKRRQVWQARQHARDGRRD